MKADPILQEIWDIKDRLAAEAGYDIHRFGEQLRAWSEAHPHLVTPVGDAGAGQKIEDDGTGLVLREEPEKSDGGE